MYSNKIVTVINSNFKKDVFLSSHPYTSSFSFMSGQLQMISLAVISLLTNKMFETIETLAVNISNLILETLSSVQFSSIAQSCPTLCDPMNCSTLGLPVHHQFPEFTQIHAHRVGDAIQPSHPLSSPSPPAPNPSQHQGLFQ